MTQITEIVEEKAKVLIVSEKNQQFVWLLKQELKKYKAEVFFSPVIPPDLGQFEYCFLINQKDLPEKKFPKSKKITFIF